MNNNLPFFSIVTISYNQADFIEEAILSVLNQNYPSYEYFIQDACSTDDTPNILNKYYNHPNITITRSPDLGPADGLARTFRRLRGSHAIYLNSDDFLVPKSLFSCADLVRKYPNYVITGSANFVDHEGELLYEIKSDTFNKLYAAFGLCTIIQPSTIIPLNLYQKTQGFNPLNKTNWDHELLIDLCMIDAQFISVPCILSCYRVHAGSITGSGRLARQHKQYRYYIINKCYPRLAPPFASIILVSLWLFVRLTRPIHTLRRLFGKKVFGKYK